MIVVQGSRAFGQARALIVSTPAVDPSAFRRIHLYTLGFFIAAAAVRVGLVNASGVPISSYGVFFSLAAAPYLAMGAFLTFDRFSLAAFPRT